MNAIPQEHMNRWLELMGDEYNEALRFYFENILPIAVEIAGARDIEEAIANRQCLVSLMGFSPETTVIATAVVRPERLVVVTGKNTMEHYNLAFDALNSLGILRPSQIDKEVITPDAPREIYDAVAKHLRDADETALVDVTGGKKIMSATAAQAAWEQNTPLCYVEGEYDPGIRRPKPGTERIIMLLNPSKERALEKRRNALQAYGMRQYQQAAELFQVSLEQNADHQLEELAIPLCQVYAAMADFRLDAVEEYVGELDRITERPYLRRHVKDTGIDCCLDPLRGDPRLEMTTTRLAVFLSFARIYAAQKRFDFASLLAYRAIEAVVEEGLRRQGKTGLDTGCPDYSLLTDDVDRLAEEYADLSRNMDPSAEQETKLPQKLGLLNGLCILALMRPEPIQNLFGKQTMRVPDALGRVRGIANLRNRSILAHGTATLTEEDYDKIADLAVRLANAIIPEEDISALVASLEPPDLEEAAS